MKSRRFVIKAIDQRPGIVLIEAETGDEYLCKGKALPLGHPSANGKQIKIQMKPPLWGPNPDYKPERKKKKKVENQTKATPKQKRKPKDKPKEKDTNMKQDKNLTQLRGLLESKPGHSEFKNIAGLVHGIEDPHQQAMALEYAREYTKDWPRWEATLPLSMVWPDFPNGSISPIAILVKSINHGASPEAPQGLTDDQMETVANSPHMANLENIWGGNIGDKGLTAIANSPHLKKLKRLELGRAHRITPLAIKALVSSANIERLEYLGLEDTEIGDAGLIAIAKSPNIQNLKELYVGNCECTDAGAIAIAKSPNIQGLEGLGLSGNNLGDKAAIAFAKSPHVRNLKYLNLGSNNITNKGAAALLEPKHMDSIEDILLDRCDIDHKGALMIDMQDDIIVQI